MNKRQLIESVATHMNSSKADAGRAVEAVLTSIENGLKEDNSVTIAGFGTFSRRKRAARTLRNPTTGDPIEVKESLTVGFKPSPALRNGM